MWGNTAFNNGVTGNDEVMMASNAEMTAFWKIYLTNSLNANKRPVYRVLHWSLQLTRHGLEGGGWVPVLVDLLLLPGPGLVLGGEIPPPLRRPGAGLVTWGLELRRRLPGMVVKLIREEQISRRGSLVRCNINFVNFWKIAICFLFLFAVLSIGAI